MQVYPRISECQRGRKQQTPTPASTEIYKEETEAQREAVTCSGSLSEGKPELGLEEGLALQKGTEADVVPPLVSFACSRLASNGIR